MSRWYANNISCAICFSVAVKGIMYILFSWTKVLENIYFIDWTKVQKKKTPVNPPTEVGGYFKMQYA